MMPHDQPTKYPRKICMEFLDRQMPARLRMDRSSGLGFEMALQSVGLQQHFLELVGIFSQIMPKPSEVRPFFSTKGGGECYGEAGNIFHMRVERLPIFWGFPLFTVGIVTHNISTLTDPFLASSFAFNFQIQD
jgi:hypothetical protein